MYDYRMFSDGAAAGENVINLIKKKLKSQGITTGNSFRFVGFEGEAGTKFKLNDQEDWIAIPTSGSFISPFGEEHFMPIHSLVF